MISQISYLLFQGGHSYLFDVPQGFVMQESPRSIVPTAVCQDETVVPSITAFVAGVPVTHGALSLQMPRKRQLKMIQ